MEKRHYKLHISGKVQGVWYRASARDKARELGLAGFVRNEPDGSVYAEAEGPPAALEQFADWCRQGPPNARVREVRVETGEVQGYEGFVINRKTD